MRATTPSSCSGGSRGRPVPDPRALAGGAPLLRRPRWPLRPASAHRASSSPRAEDEVQTIPGLGPKPSAEYACEDAGYGSVRVRAWAELHPKVRNHEGRGSRGPLPIVVGTLVLVEVERLPRSERGGSPGHCGCGGMGRRGRRRSLRSHLSSYVRRFKSGAYLPLCQAEHGVDDARGFATPSRPTGGRGGWCWPPTRS